MILNLVSLWAFGLLSIPATVLLHEGGHLLALRLLGDRTARVELHLLGPYRCHFDPALPLSKKIVGTLGGPFSNLVFATFFWCVMMYTHDITWLVWIASNLVSGFGNMAPFKGSDGLRALAYYREWRAATLPPA